MLHRRLIGHVIWVIQNFTKIERFVHNGQKVSMCMYIKHKKRTVNYGATWIWYSVNGQCVVPVVIFPHCVHESTMYSESVAPLPWITNQIWSSSPCKYENTQWHQNLFLSRRASSKILCSVCVCVCVWQWVSLIKPFNDKFWVSKYL